MAIWGVSPDSVKLYGRDGLSLLVQWTDAVMPDTQPKISLRLFRSDPNDPNLGDPNFAGPYLLAEGIDAVTDEQGDQWQFSGIDIYSNPIPSGTYKVGYIIDDANGTIATASSKGTITMPLRFTVPSTDLTIYQTSGLVFQWDSLVLSGRVDIALAKDPNDSNSIAYVNKTGMIIGIATSQPFNGTVYDANEPNGRLVTPDVYSVWARVWLTGGNPPFFVPARGRLTIVKDPNT